MNNVFDGDCLNILYLINKEYIARSERVFNPRNAMYISKNDGMFNNDINHCKDILINDFGVICGWLDVLSFLF